MRAVTAAIIREGTRVLLARRGPGEKLAGAWEFPGGKVENGETPEDCLARELKEELGLDCRVGAPVAESVYAYAHGTFRLLAFDVRVVGGELALSVHDRVEWVECGELTTYALAPADVPVAEKIMKEEIRG